MRIVIEGFDGTGKSTLARLINRATDWKVFELSPSPPKCVSVLRQRNRVAVQSAIQERHALFDRWPLISEHCYGELSSCVNRIGMSLSLGGIDRIIHCDVDSEDDLIIHPRDCEADRNQTASIIIKAAEILERYRGLMSELRAMGYDVRRYKMIRGVLC